MKALGWALAVCALLVMLTLASLFGRFVNPKPADCPAMQHEAAITQRAAEICTTQLVGCTLSYQEVRAVVSEVEAARVCQ